MKAFANGGGICSITTNKNVYVVEMHYRRQTSWVYKTKDFRSAWKTFLQCTTTNVKPQIEKC